MWVLSSSSFCYRGVELCHFCSTRRAGKLYDFWKGFFRVFVCLLPSSTHTFAVADSVCLTLIRSSPSEQESVARNDSCWHLKVKGRRWSRGRCWGKRIKFSPSPGSQPTSEFPVCYHDDGGCCGKTCWLTIITAPDEMFVHTEEPKPVRKQERGSLSHKHSLLAYDEGDDDDDDAGKSGSRLSRWNGVFWQHQRLFLFGKCIKIRCNL